MPRRSPHIALCGPVTTSALAEFLDTDTAAAPAGLGGMPLCSVARGLLKNRLQVTICSLDPSVQHPVTLRGELLTLRYGPFRERRHMRDGMRLERTAIRDLLRESRPDLVNAHWTYEYALGALASGYPTLVTAHDWGPAIVRYAPIPYWFARQPMYVWAVHRADALSAVSPYLCRRIARFTGRHVNLTPNALDPSWYVEGPRTLNQDCPVVTSINAGFTARKNVSPLLQAMPLVREAAPSCRLTLVGSDFEPGGVAWQWAHSRGLADGVDFLGPLTSAGVRGVLTKTDVLVHPSREEAFGMTLIEAMACGTPMVGGLRSGAVPWVLDGGRAGVLTDVRSPDSIAASVAALITTPELWQRYSLAGFRHVRTTFSLERIVDAYLNAYERLLLRARRSRA
jgi:L-malate glycosyltransferase